MQCVLVLLPPLPPSALPATTQTRLQTAGPALCLCCCICGSTLLKHLLLCWSTHKLKGEVLRVSYVSCTCANDMTRVMQRVMQPRQRTGVSIDV